ncbi:MAG TPA: hypothetical protein VKB59_09975 [Micromonosporaceae bacterium]|nr:hypothetical protein [Micromonosporaceae bacterium]
MGHTGVHRWRATAMLSGLLLIVAGCTGSPATPRRDATAHPSPIAPTTAAPPTTNAGAAADAPCQFKLRTDDLPTWARSGFRGPPWNAWPYAVSSGGDIVAVLFGYPFVAPEPSAAESQNKILWVPKDPSAGELTVDARLVGTSQNADVGDISFGPSIVDVPKPGCWRMTLHWLGPTETIDIMYGAKP